LEENSPNIFHMPLYMDIHFIGEVSLEDTRKAHLADLAVQEKYGVTYLQYWFNEEAGTVYCLMEGPDKESCAATHREANGITACQIVEVEGGIYDLFMGENQKVDHGLVRKESGELDAGYRYILTLDIIARTQSPVAIDFNQLKLPKEPKDKALKFIYECDGKEIKQEGFDSIVAVFETPEKVLKCAHTIQKEFLKNHNSPDSENGSISFNMGISAGQPLTETEGFFEKAIQLSKRLCLIAGDTEITTSRLFEELCDINEIIRNHMHVRIINPAEQEFLDNFLDITDSHYSDHEFGVEFLSRDMAVSQPQLYRKVTALTGRSPVNFIRDIRLNKALSLIKENKYNLSEIALEVGYNSPSYFSRCFQQKFGIQPSRISI
jgi:AraC-like DNA-binding protein